MDNLHIHVAEDIYKEFSNQVISFARIATGPWSFFASGGSLTPKLYGTLVAQPEFVDLSQHMGFYLGDERVVDPESDDSNMFNLKKWLLDPLAEQGARPAAFPPFSKLEYQDLAQRFSGDASADYPLCADLAAKYAVVIDRAPKPWLVHLGVGPDGHTASLFPRSPGLNVSSQGQNVIANYDPNGKNPFPRLTFSLGAISQAALVIITTSGNSKAKAIQSLLEGGSQLPIAQVKAAKVVLLIDYDAASLID